MNKKTLLIAIIALLALPSLALAERGGARKGKGFGGEFRDQAKAHREQQREKSKDFRATVKNMDPDERFAAVSEHRDQQHSENIAFHQDLHNQRISALEEKLAGNDKLSDEEKGKILNEAESRFQENVARKEEQYSEASAYIEQVHNDDTLSPEQKREAIKEFRENQQEERKEYRQDRRQERKEKRKEWRKNKS